MAKKPAKPKTTEIVGLPATFNFPGSEQLEQAPEAAKKEPWEEKFEALAKSQEARDKAHADQIERLFGMLSAAPAAPTHTQTAATTKAPVLDLSGLPDPAINAVEYNRGLQDRVQKFATETIAHNAAQAQAQAAAAGSADATARRIDALWNKFSGAHPELAKHEDFVQLTAQALMQEQAALGTNVERYVFGNPDAFITKVAEKTKERLTALGWKAEGADDDGEAETDDDDAGRTAVVTGQNAGERVAAAVARVGQPQNLAADVLAWQRASKLI